MAFVRKVRTASGATAVQIAERRGGRDEVIEHLGSGRNDAELAALLQIARRKLHPGQGELALDEGHPAGQGVITAKTSPVLWQVLTNAYARLGLERVRDEAFKQLVLARIVGARNSIAIWARTRRQCGTGIS